MNKVSEQVVRLEQRLESVKLTNASLHHRIPELQEENLMLADENVKMAEYLKRLDFLGYIELEEDGFGWLF